MTPKLSLKSLAGLKSMKGLHELIRVQTKKQMNILNHIDPSVSSFVRNQRTILSYLYKDTLSTMQYLGDRDGMTVGKEIAYKWQSLESRHNLTIESFANIHKNTNQNIEPLLARQVLLQTLLSHGVQLTHTRHFSPTGCVNLKCHILNVIDGAVTQARFEAESSLLFRPEVKVYVDSENKNENIEDGAFYKEHFKAPCVPSSIHFIIVELLKNAIYATHKREKKTGNIVPPIELITSRSPSHLDIKVRDYGIGMDVESIKQCVLFLATATVAVDSLVDEQASYQPMSSPFQGLGVGLALAKIHAEMFGGELHISQNQNQDATGIDVLLRLVLDDTIEAKF